ncbi:uncharacterized protein PV09_02294 [Verruconis gallopava]|uniref:2',3'-cyclic-nucleotide 3'-phosphodiesterase n=1 Tax=Verruconis gallopava TaxID=253628 RepID=A0A0D2AJ63_9PEZI|nr:uncharacterized protein PV09_02294 [Verruconis gallopava]KIW06575.1 hypothetical protein PV09_02294 [Verruconis gallopava]
MPPRYSLWLLPPPGATDINNKLSDLISTKIPSLFPDTKLPNFAPHITLATGIDESLLGAKAVDGWPAWLNSLDLRSAAGVDEPQIIFDGIGVGDTYTKKCYLHVQRTRGLEMLAKRLQMQVFGSGEDRAADWVLNGWDPHLSLLYWDGIITATKLEEVKSLFIDGELNAIGISGGKCTAWTGGNLQLVNTSQPVEQWSVLAQRRLQG